MKTIKDVMIDLINKHAFVEIAHIEPGETRDKDCYIIQLKIDHPHYKNKAKTFITNRDGSDFVVQDNDNDIDEELMKVANAFIYASTYDVEEYENSKLEYCEVADIVYNKAKKLWNSYTYSIAA
jgi:hypothetical protein